MMIRYGSLLFGATLYVLHYSIKIIGVNNLFFVIIFLKRRHLNRIVLRISLVSRIFWFGVFGAYAAHPLCYSL